MTRTQQYAVTGFVVLAVALYLYRRRGEPVSVVVRDNRVRAPDLAPLPRVIPIDSVIQEPTAPVYRLPGGGSGTVPGPYLGEPGKGGKVPKTPQDKSTLDIGIFNGAWQLDNDRAENKMIAEVAERSNVILGVETYDIPMRKRLGGEWSVLQRRQKPGQSNAVVATRDLPVMREGVAGTVRTPGNIRMRTRWIPFRLIRMPDGTVIRVGAYHRPPPRYRFVWPVYDAAVVAWIRSSKVPTVLGGDFNTTTLKRLERATGYRYVHRGIMGALVSRDLEIVDRWHEKMSRASDHKIVGISVRPKR